MENTVTSIRTHIMRTALLLLALSTINSPLSTLHAQGTAFTHEGRLSDGSNPANGIYDLRFTIYDAGTGGNVAGGPLTLSATGVTNGLFTVTLDFGSGVFTGPPRWLEIAVRTNGASSFATLTPRQLLAPAPYAMMAAGANKLVGTLPATQLSGTIPLTQLPSVVPTNSSLTVNAGTGLSGGGVVSLGGSTTLSIANGGVGAAQLAAGAVGSTQLAATLASGIVPWQTVAGTSQMATPNAGYVLTNAARTTVTLPNTANVGDIVRVSGLGAGGWAVFVMSSTWTAHDSNRFWEAVASSADGNKLVAVEDLGQIYTSTNSGVTWTPQFGDGMQDWYSVASSADGTKLVAVDYGGYIYTRAPLLTGLQGTTASLQYIGNGQWQPLNES